MKQNQRDLIKLARKYGWISERHVNAKVTLRHPNGDMIILSDHVGFGRQYHNFELRLSHHTKLVKRRIK